MKPNRKWLIAAAIVLVLVVPIVIKKNRGASATEVDLATAAPQLVQPSILASGTLAFRNEVNLTSEVTGKVRTLLVKEGDTVEAGQTLLLLDPELYNNAIEREEAGLRQTRIAIERQRAQVALRRTQFERSQVLVQQKLIDRNRFDEDRNQLQVAEAELRTSEESLRRAESVVNDAREQRARTEIRAPISGRIVSLPIKVGETAVPSTSAFAGAQLMKIADTSEIIAELKVDEADIAKVGVGQRVEVFAAAYPDTALKGSVEQIALAPTIEGQGRAYKVTVRIVPPDGLSLRSGMSVRADIFLGDGQRRLAVPVEAVSTDTGDDGKPVRHVWLAKAGKATKVQVQTGASDDRWEVVAKGIAQGDTVIVGPAKALRGLSEGAQVKRRDPEKAKDDAGDDDKGAADDAKDAG
jgi:HlyD family secretion protein